MTGWADLSAAVGITWVVLRTTPLSRLGVPVVGWKALILNPSPTILSDRARLGKFGSLAIQESTNEVSVGTVRRDQVDRREPTGDRVLPRAVYSVLHDGFKDSGLIESAVGVKRLRDPSFDEQVG